MRQASKTVIIGMCVLCCSFNLMRQSFKMSGLFFMSPFLDERRRTTLGDSHHMILQHLLEDIIPSSDTKGRKQNSGSLPLDFEQYETADAQERTGTGSAMLIRDTDSEPLHPGTIVTTNFNQTIPSFAEGPLRIQNTVLALIAFGNATKQNHVQRCIRSARTRGKWKGRIVILTDSRDAYKDLIKQDPLIRVIHPRKRDWDDLPRFKHAKLIFKRFKTLLIEYIEEEPKFEDVEHILYMDIDIIVARPIGPWLRRKWRQGRKVRNETPSDTSIMWMFRAGGTHLGHVTHSGVVLVHTKLSRWCLEKWRRMIDNKRLQWGRDQALLRQIIKKGPKHTKCRIQAWPKGKELIFPMPKDFEKRKFYNFVHITNTFHAGNTDAQIQKEFLEDALQLTPEERRSPNSLAIVPEAF